jgi:hypothetical protein
MRQQFELRMSSDPTKIPADLSALLREGGVIDRDPTPDPHVFDFYDPVITRMIANALEGENQTDPLLVAADELDHAATLEFLVDRIS